MRSTTLKYIYFFAWLCLFSGCVSVNLGGSSGAKRAEGVQFTSPSKPFEKEARTDVDGAWKNPRNGNLISYISDCQDSSDPSLDGIIQGVLSGLNDLKIDSNETATVQGREAKRAVAQGKVDGVSTKIDLLTFKRNQCIYILSYVGVLKSFGEDHSAFDRFLKDFRAP